ncbi:hypothetical protein [Kocuria massiliensis]|uniref:hypothetical protein n=1 Tax=Kocuria massiliensis TaxID=1926282 RepID=UPI00156E8E5C|nr:hypothetical protein [Kocuria massiliensis]
MATDRSTAWMMNATHGEQSSILTIHRQKHSARVGSQQERNSHLALDAAPLLPARASLSL